MAPLLRARPAEVPSAAIDTAERPLSANGIEIDVAGRTAWVPAISAVPPLEAVISNGRAP